jgi:hypothetical protein
MCWVSWKKLQRCSTRYRGYHDWHGRLMQVPKTNVFLMEEMRRRTRTPEDARDSQSEPALVLLE